MLKIFNKNYRNNRNISIFTSISYHSVFWRPPFLFFQHNQQCDTLLPIVPCTHKLKAGIAYSHLELYGMYAFEKSALCNVKYSYTLDSNMCYHAAYYFRVAICLERIFIELSIVYSIVLRLKYHWNCLIRHIHYGWFREKSILCECKFYLWCVGLCTYY